MAQVLKLPDPVITNNRNIFCVFVKLFLITVILR